MFVIYTDKTGFYGTERIPLIHSFSPCRDSSANFSFYFLKSIHNNAKNKQKQIST